jgi:hypothetical protein
MSAFVCGGHGGSVEFPDLGEATMGCCWGTVIRGPENCTCWEPEYSLEQAEPEKDLLPMPRAKMCDDCAFRPNSPERNGDDSYANADDGALDELVAGGQPFYCHTGMRLPLRWVHPSGATVDGHPGAYDPPIVRRDGIPVPYKADGTPANICAGWWMRFQHQRDAAS